MFKMVAINQVLSAWLLRNVTSVFQASAPLRLLHGVTGWVGKHFRLKELKNRVTLPGGKLVQLLE